MGTEWSKYLAEASRDSQDECIQRPEARRGCAKGELLASKAEEAGMTMNASTREVAASRAAKAPALHIMGAAWREPFPDETSAGISLCLPGNLTLRPLPLKK